VLEIMFFSGMSVRPSVCMIILSLTYLYWRSALRGHCWGYEL